MQIIILILLNKIYPVKNVVPEGLLMKLLKFFMATVITDIQDIIFHNCPSRLRPYHKIKRWKLMNVSQSKAKYYRVTCVLALN